ncbi:SPOR domain-containing protein [Shewanella schlegeliana]|uniref:SPOR domain-containing protein n=1 Tax=Shewanella schlegeliana TaxID=190308 RepID=A0ABS1SX67_9GAMM|nr:SPOR domain-containing protein [Shewanella schlegeliana]MBL4913140.1 SPOR domain-containing protein [Shewanella schlegeliana]MCL1111154.1 SPOR domain-containing protein [Shewanella schlegeliana]GIU28070.1 cell division protein DedD [Shewanella schlegeliana]
MSSQFQNRLVGVIVIVALGVIFLPDILDGKKQREEEQFAEIPLRPEIQQSELPEQNIETLDLGADGNSLADGSLPADGSKSADDEGASDDSWHIAEEGGQSQKSEAKLASTQVNKPASESTKPAAKPKAAWTIQLGSFNNAANVRGLVKRLRDKGFTAYTLPTKPVDGQLTKVFVGPNVSKDKLSRMQADIEKLTELKGRVVAYNPVEK